MPIYRFIKPIQLPDGVILPIGDAVILDDINSKDPVALAVLKAEKDGFRDIPQSLKQDK